LLFRKLIVFTSYTWKKFARFMRLPLPTLRAAAFRRNFAHTAQTTRPDLNNRRAKIGKHLKSKYLAAILIFVRDTCRFRKPVSACKK